MAFFDFLKKYGNILCGLIINNESNTLNGQKK